MANKVGTAPNQLVIHGHLGGMAYQDPKAVNIVGGKVGGLDIASLQQTILEAGKVKTVNGQSPDANGDVALTKAHVGLPNVDNTSDVNKPISTAVQVALKSKVTNGPTVFFGEANTFRLLSSNGKNYFQSGDGSGSGGWQNLIFGPYSSGVIYATITPDGFVGKGAGLTDLSMANVTGLSAALGGKLDKTATAAAAAKLANARKIAGKDFDGTADISLEPDDVGAAPASHTHTAAQISGLHAVATSGSYNDLEDKPTIPTVPGVATTSAEGLMSSADKTKLDAVGSMANRNVTISTEPPPASGGVDGDIWIQV